MAFQKGQPKIGGRKAGTPNRATLHVQEILDRLKCDPVTIMATICMDQNNPAELRAKMAAELCQYIYPKRRAIEHSGPDGGKIPLEAIDRLIQGAADDDEDEDASDLVQ